MYILRYVILRSFADDRLPLVTGRCSRVKGRG